MKENSLTVRKQSFLNIINNFKKNVLRFLVFDALEANDAKAYVKKPNPGKASKQFHNKKPPATTQRGNKHFRPDNEVEDEFAGPSPAPPPNTGTSKKIRFWLHGSKVFSSLKMTKFVSGFHSRSSSKKFIQKLMTIFKGEKFYIRKVPVHNNKKLEEFSPLTLGWQVPVLLYMFGIRIQILWHLSIRISICSKNYQ